MAGGDMNRDELEEALRNAPVAEIQPPNFIITNAIVSSYGISATGDAYRALAVADKAIDALEAGGWSIVRTDDVAGVVEAIDTLSTKLATGINLTRGIPTNSYIEKGYGQSQRAANERPEVGEPRPLRPAPLAESEPT